MFIPWKLLEQNYDAPTLSLPHARSVCKQHHPCTLQRNPLLFYPEDNSVRRVTHGDWLMVPWWASKHGICLSLLVPGSALNMLALSLNWLFSADPWVGLGGGGVGVLPYYFLPGICGVKLSAVYLQLIQYIKESLCVCDLEKGAYVGLENGFLHLFILHLSPLPLLIGWVPNPAGGRVNSLSAGMEEIAIFGFPTTHHHPILGPLR